MIYTNPQPINYEEEVEKRGVLERHFETAKLQRARRVAGLQLSILRRFVKGNRLLDFGAGAGVLVHEARRCGWDAVGIDLNVGLAEATNQHWHFDAVKAVGLDEFVACTHDRFDAIVSNQVFEHLQKPLDAGRLLVDILKRGGTFLIDVPNVNQLKERRQRGVTLDPTSHFNHFSSVTLKEFVRRIQCEPVYCSASPSMIELFHRLHLDRIANPLGRIGKRVLPAIGSGVCVIGRKR